MCSNDTMQCVTLLNFLLVSLFFLSSNAHRVDEVDAPIFSKEKERDYLSRDNAESDARGANDDDSLFRQPQRYAFFYDAVTRTRVSAAATTAAVTAAAGILVACVHNTRTHTYVIHTFVRTYIRHTYIIHMYIHTSFIHTYVRTPHVYTYIIHICVYIHIYIYTYTTVVCKAVTKASQTNLIAFKRHTRYETTELLPT